jgi:hypothetical protein
LQHQSLGNALISREVLLKGAPIFVAVMVWLSRVLIIGTFSVAGENLFIGAGQRVPTRIPAQRQVAAYKTTRNPKTAQTAIQARPSYSSYRPAPKPNRGEVYQQVPTSAKERGGTEYRRYS